jgi:N-acetylglucosaminyldiphosphoundecaprenol N-acetyl-beta-D-mannosaminyltransferase
MDTSGAPSSPARGESDTGCRILGMRVDPTSYDDAARRVMDWAAAEVGRYVCVANVHMVMEAWDDHRFREVVNEADLVTPDGMPLVWALRRLGAPAAVRVYGPTLTLHVCELAARQGVPVGFYGGSPDAIAGLVRFVGARFPSLDVAYAVSPPFRRLTADEDADTVAAIVASGARVLFVGLGCPQQERWMAEHRDRLPLVQLGVGAAFDFHAGLVRQAPPVLQRVGLEWAFRLAMEPRRLARRYLRHNPRFLWHLGRQLRAERRGAKVRAGRNAE